MIYFFGGDDSNKKLESYEKFMASVPGGNEIFFVTRNNFDRMQIESLYSGTGLFFKKATVVLSSVLEHEETRDFILKNIELIGSSGNDFLFLEGKPNKPILDLLKKFGAKINIFDLPKAKKEKFDNFLVANAFERKDKLSAWIYFREAIDKGVVMEEIIGVLFWKIKDMILKKNFHKFSEAELKNSASRLSCLLPLARKEGRDSESAFEQFLLEAF